MYYIGNMPFGQEDLQHWGVLGMKWGVRRYQNSDGTLTEAGKKRYGATGHYEYKSIGQKLKARQLAKTEAKNDEYRKKIVSKAVKSPDGKSYQIPYDSDFRKAQKYGDRYFKQKSQLEAYKKRDADRQKYAEKTSGLKAGVQKGLKVLIGGIRPGGIDVQYQRARSRGEGRVSSLLKSPSMLVSVGALAGVAAGGAFAYNRFVKEFGEKAVKRILDYGARLPSTMAADAHARNLYLHSTVDAMKKAGAAGVVAGYAGSKIHTMNENKKKYGHRMWT